MTPHSLCLSIGYRANIARQLGVTNVSFHYYEGISEHTDRKIANSGMHLFLLNTLMGGLEKRSAKKCMLKVAQRIVSKLLSLVRDKAAKEAEELCALGQYEAAQVPLKLAIDLGHLPSRAHYACMLIVGREGVASDRNAAFELVKVGVRLGCHHCQGVMAWYYCENTYGCVMDAARSLELARESSGKGSRYGQYVLGWLYLNGGGGVAQDDAQAVALYRLAAAQNLDEAQFSLGDMHYHGRGVAPDFAEALRLYQLAAAQGHPEALFNVAQRARSRRS